MKKLLTLLLALAMMISLVACGANESAPSSTATTSVPVSEAGGQKAKIDAYLTKDITVIVPFSAGGNADLSMRALVQGANDSGLFGGATLVVENVSGGGAVIGQTQAFENAADGYTLMLYTSSVINNDLFNETEYRYNDFLPICGYCPDPEVLYVPANSPYNTWEELIEAAKTKTLVASTPGHTTGHHIRLMNMAEDYSVNFDYVHTDSAAEQMLQVLGNQVDFSMNTLGSALSNYKDGQIKILGIATESRRNECPDVPTFAEMGYNLVDGANRGLAIKKDGVDMDIYNWLVETFKQVCETQSFISGMENIGCIPEWQSPGSYQTYMDTTYQSIEKIIPKLEEAAAK